MPKLDYWREIMAALQHAASINATNYDEITIQNAAMLKQYRGAFPEAKLGMTIRIPRPQRFKHA